MLPWRLTSLPSLLSLPPAPAGVVALHSGKLQTITHFVGFLRLNEQLICPKDPVGLDIQPSHTPVQPLETSA